MTKFDSIPLFRTSANGGYMIRTTALLLVLSSAAAAQTRPAWDGAFSATQADRGRAA